MNPELLRNIWRELGLQRLVAMPVILFAIFFIAYLRSDHSSIAVLHAAEAIIFLLLVVWGSGLAADSVFEEIRDRTWNSQKMTPISAWSMSWGKLFGSTIFAWYGTICCLLAIVIQSHSLFGEDALQPAQVLFEIAYIILMGLLAETLALFISLLFLRIRPARIRPLVIFIQIFAIVVTSLLYLFGKDALPKILEIHQWYNSTISVKEFLLGSQLFFLFWLVVGIFRLMRLELQLSNFPWALPIFSILLVFYLVGFVYIKEDEIPAVFMQTIYWGVAYLVFIYITFIAAFFTPKNIVYYRQCLENFRQKNFKSALKLFPVWLWMFLIACLILIPLVILLLSSEFPKPLTGLSLFGFCISILLFTLRDVGLLYYLTWNETAKRAHLATIVYLVILYTVVPGLLLSMDFISQYWYPVLVPWSWILIPEESNYTRIIVVNFLVLLQAIILWMGVSARWRAHLLKLH